MGLYLFLQVRATPAQAQATITPQPRASRPAPRAEHTAPPPRPTPPPPSAAARPSRPGIDFKPVHTVAPELPTSAAEAPHPNVPLDSMMQLANKAYDRQDFDQAIEIAGKVLAKDPDNVRMLRVMVSANCIAGDSAVAQQAYEKLPDFDRGQMRARCDRYGVTFEEPSR